MARRRIAVALAAILVALVLAGTGWGDRSLYPPAPGSGISIYLVSNGFHSGLVLPREAVAATSGRDGRGALIAVATRFAHYDWIEAGWGEDLFYRAVPTFASFSWTLALRALFRPGNAAVMHVVGIEGEPGPVFAGADLVRIEVSPEGFARLLAGVDGSFARDASGLPMDLGPGLYGPSLFYRATGVFSFMTVCNHWTAHQLGVAGVPISPLLATVPRGLVVDLAIRSGLFREPDGLSAPPATH